MSSIVFVLQLVLVKSPSFE